MDSTINPIGFVLGGLVVVLLIAAAALRLIF